MKRAVIVFFLAATGMLGACKSGDTSHRDVEQSLADRERGLNERNLDLYLSAISTQYGSDVTTYGKAASTATYATLKKRAAKLFGVLDAIRYTSSERSLYDEPDGRIRVIQRYAMELHPRPLTTATQPVTTSAARFKSLSGQEQLWLVKEADGHWRIVGGL